MRLRSRGGTGVVIGVGVLALGAVGALAASQYLDRASIERTLPAPGASVPTADPMIAVTTANVDRLSDLRVVVDGKDLTARAAGAGNDLVIPTEGLSEGRHQVEVSFTTANVFARTVTKRWSFRVDTTRPSLALKSPAPGALSARRTVRFDGTSEPGARIALTWTGGRAAGRAERNGRFIVKGKLPEGVSTAQLVARDRAGNATALATDVLVDTRAPALAVSAPATGGRLTETDQPVFFGTVDNEEPSRLTFGATVNGTQIPPVLGADARIAGRDDTLASISAEVGATSAASALELDGNKFALSVGALPQGTSRVSVWVRDPAGNTVRRSFRVNVDSNEEFGSASLVKGATGADVTALQERLREAGVFRAASSGRFDAKTVKAVRLYQKRHEQKVNGIVGQRTLRAMVGRIVIDLSQYRLRLIRDGRVARMYSIAIGQAAYPTPTGSFEVVVKQKDPTWSPPDSPWAEGLGPIPPGPGNPLGTRWIGTSSPAIGIHGTYAGYSIGTAASHGCLRMHIPEVEALYEEVSVGMPVIIQQ